LREHIGRLDEPLEKTLRRVLREDCAKPANNRLGAIASGVFEYAKEGVDDWINRLRLRRPQPRVAQPVITDEKHPT